MTQHTAQSVHRAGILIVEDERVVARDLQQTLESMGFDAFAIASSSAEAVAAVERRRPDLVLMDIRIKGHIDGVGTAQTLRVKFGMPVIFLTAHADDATLSRVAVAEPLGYLVKPVREYELKSAITIALYRHRLEVEKRQRERWHATTLRSLGDGVMSVDTKGAVTYLNPAAERILGITSAAAEGVPVGEVLRLEVDAPEGPVEQVLKHHQALQGWSGSVTQLGTKKRILVQDSAAPIMDNDEMLGVVVVFRDVTETRALEQRLEVADRLIALGTLAAGVAHELNNPLSVICSNAATVTTALAEVRDHPTAEGFAECAEMVADVAQAAGRMSTIVSDLRQFSRGPSPAEVGEADVMKTVQWVLRTLAHQLREVRVEVELTPLSLVSLDETRLGQVLINLLVNAAQAMEQQPRAERLIRLTGSTVGPQVRLVLADTGPGVDPRTRERLFEPFFTTKPPGKGTGLGLWVCHNIITECGGAIAVESTPGAGTTFRLTLPVVNRAKACVADNGANKA